MNFSDNSFFCILPWVHLHISQSGKVFPCCNNNRFLGNVQEQTINDIWNDEQFNELRNNFSLNKPDKRCAHCYNIEKSGKESLRIQSNNKYKKDFFRVTENKPYPIYLDIRFSNICNFKCKTCWHGNSSAWFKEGSKRNASEKRIIKAFTQNFDELLGYLDSVEEIYFAGGEPLIMDEHYLILDELKKRGLTNVLLRYNTNFSNLNYKNIDILNEWKHFKNVKVSASIDASYHLGAEIREGFDWDKFIDNRKRMINECPTIYFEIAPTVSSLNIFDLSILHQTLVNNGLITINNIYLNFLERPKEYNIKSLNQKEKAEAIQQIKLHISWLEDNNAAISVIKEFNDLLNYL